MAEIKFEIEKELGSISESPKGWTKELNLISWNGNEAKYGATRCNMKSIE